MSHYFIKLLKLGKIKIPKRRNKTKSHNTELTEILIKKQKQLSSQENTVLLSPFTLQKQINNTKKSIILQ